MSANVVLPRHSAGVHLALCLVLALVLSLVHPARSASGPGGLPLRVISSDENRLVIELDLSGYRLAPSDGLDGTMRLDVPGFGGTSEPGKPLVPLRTLLVALPPEGGYTLSHTVQGTVNLGRQRLEPVPFPMLVEGEGGLKSTSHTYRIDEAIYRQGSVALGVTGEAPGKIRHQRVLPVRVAPVAYDAASGETILATSIRIEVTFERGGGGTGRRIDGTRVPVQESAVWDQIFGRILVNPDQAREWRVKISRHPQASESLFRVREALAGPLVKLRVRETALQRVRASSAIAAGFPGGTALSNVHLFKRTYEDTAGVEGIVEIPYTILEDPSGTPGLFDDADQLVFYGQRLRDDALQGDPTEKFADHNVYWLGPSPGTQMGQKPLATGMVSPDTATTFFPVSRRFEQDLWFIEKTPPRARDVYYYNFGGEFSGAFATPFSLDAIRTDGTFRVKAEFVGQATDRTPREVLIEIQNSNGTTVLNSAFVSSRGAPTVYLSQDFPASALAEGVNTFRIKKTSERSVLEVALNWFVIEYESPYRARGNVLDFNTGSSTGDTTFSITGLGRDDVMLFDVTDPLDPLLCPLGAGHFTPVGGGYVLSFRENLTEERRYALYPLDKIREIAPADIVGDEPSSIIGDPAESGVDILFVTHQLFLNETLRLADHRRAQGYRVLVADAAELYDEFNGGVPHARAIRRFVKRFFELGNASYVVLVGDASEDNKRVHNDSGVNFVPTESFPEAVLGGGFNEDEVVTTDKWYTMLDFDFINESEPPPQGILAYYPDLIIGRLPVGSVIEARALVDKIIAFEKPSASDSWRRRMIRVADNAWSGGNTLCLNAVERGFEAAEDTAAAITERSIRGGFDVIRFFLADKFQHPPPTSCPILSDFTTPTRSVVTPALIGELNTGATIVSIQAHMNRFQICHEVLFTSSTSWRSGGDHSVIENPGRPFVVFGMGCHLSDYALHKELSRFVFNPPAGDCISELLLLRDDKGAIATYGSTGYEYLSTNVGYTRVLTETFFNNPPTAPTVPRFKAQARWIMGELMTVAEMENMNEFPNYWAAPGNGSVGQTKRYHTLGDPVLRIDAGPPRFDVTVGGQPFESGDLLIASGGSDVVDIRAIVTDEVAIEDITLEIGGVDSTSQLQKKALIDTLLDASRQYEVTFTHTLEPREYDIILRAHQAEDTLAGTYHMVGEFVFKVAFVGQLSVDGRPVMSGELVPTRADYVYEVKLPVFVPPEDISVAIDGNNVDPLSLLHPSPEDSLTWLIGFTLDLDRGTHDLKIGVGQAELDFTLLVETQQGLLDLIAYPNPFSDETYFVYTSPVEISGGAIDIFTTSGKKVARLDIPLSARGVGQNAVHWDGRTRNGDQVANGVYLYVVTVDQDGGRSTHRGRLVKMQ